MVGRVIAVGGCGIGGLATALLLARSGERVVMFERPRPLGSGLMIQPTGLAVLARLGLAERFMRDGARVERLFGMAGRRVVLDVGYAALGRGDHADRRCTLLSACSRMIWGLCGAILDSSSAWRRRHKCAERKARGENLPAGESRGLYLQVEPKGGPRWVADGLVARPGAIRCAAPAASG